MDPLTKPLEVVWRWYTKNYNETNIVLVYKDVVANPGDNCIVVAIICSKDNCLMEFGQRI